MVPLPSRRSAAVGVMRLVILTLCACLLAPGAALAAFPGANGKIAVPNGSGIALVNADGSGFSQITTTPDDWPSFSADGKRIAFATYRHGADAEIYTMSADGSGQLRLTNDPATDDMPTWSPDGTKIAFVSTRDSGSFNYDIYTMNANGTGVTNLTNTPSVDEVYPTWSPDGTRLAFTKPDEIYVMNADGTGQTPLTSNFDADLFPEWSPDGKKIAFSSNRDGDHEIFVMNQDGSGQTQLTSNGALDWEPVWSPDGSRLAFQSDRDGDTLGLYVMSAGGDLETRVSTLVTLRHPTWQPRYEIPAGSPPLSVGLVPSYRQTISPSQCAARGGVATTHAAPLSLSACNPPGYLPGTTARFGIQAVGSATLTVVPGDPATLADEADHAIVVDLTDIRAGAPLGADYNPVAAGADATMLMRFRLSDTLNGPDAADPGTVTDSELAVPVDCATTADPNIGSHCAATTSADGITAGLVKEGRNAVTSLFRVRLRDSGTNGVRGDGDDKEFATQGVYTP